MTSLTAGSLTVNPLTASPLIVAQITDTHLFADEEREFLQCRTVRSFRAMIEQIDRLSPRPHLLLLTGDLSQDETIESYEQLHKAIEPLHIPTYWVPGNHDQELSVMTQRLSSAPFSAEKSFIAGGWHFVLLNSMVPQQVHGRVSSENLAWLEQQLTTHRDRPTLIAVHHHLLPIGSDWMDHIGLLNAADLLQTIDRHPQVKLVICGHIHQEFSADRQGVSYLGTPSSCIQFRPNSPVFAIDAEQPGFRLLRLYADGRYETQVERLKTAVF